MEGPSLTILSEELATFVNKRIMDVAGNSKQNILKLCGKRIKAVKSWGKHLLIQLDDFTVRIHFLMFGSYRINEKKQDRAPRLSLAFKNGEINFYSCSVRFIDEDLDELYDWKVDVMSDSWDEKLILEKVKKQKTSMVCDVLMNQDIFAGVGNIIKNEVLCTLHIHPETLIKDLSITQLKALVKETRDYSFKFYEWKKKYELKKHYRIYRQRNCPNCGRKVIMRNTGKGHRRSFYCPACQKLKE